VKRNPSKVAVGVGLACIIASALLLNACSRGLPIPKVQVNLGPSDAPISALETPLGDWARSHRLAVESSGEFVRQYDATQAKTLSASCASRLSCIIAHTIPWCPAIRSQIGNNSGIPAPPNQDAARQWGEANAMLSSASSECDKAVDSGVAAAVLTINSQMFADLRSTASLFDQIFAAARIDTSKLPRPSYSVCLPGAGCSQLPTTGSP
jgi:hypothetical protein